MIQIVLQVNINDVKSDCCYGIGLTFNLFRWAQYILIHRIKIWLTCTLILATFSFIPVTIQDACFRAVERFQFKAQ